MAYKVEWCTMHGAWVDASDQTFATVAEAEAEIQKVVDDDTEATPEEQAETRSRFRVVEI